MMLELLPMVEGVCRACRLRDVCEIKEEFLEEVNFIRSNLEGNIFDTLQANEATHAAIDIAKEKGCSGEFYKGHGKVLRFDQ